MGPSPSSSQPHKKSRPKSSLEDYFLLSGSKKRPSLSQPLPFSVSQQSRPKSKRLAEPTSPARPSTQRPTTTKTSKASISSSAPVYILISSDSGSEKAATRPTKPKPGTKTAPPEVIVLTSSSSSEGTPPPQTRPKTPKKASRPVPTAPGPSQSAALSRSSPAFAPSNSPSRKRSHSTAMRDSNPSSTAHPPPSGQSLVPIASKQFKLSQTPPVDFSAPDDDHVVTNRALSEETSKPASTSRSPQVKNEPPSPSRTINPPSSPRSPADPTSPFISGSAPSLVRSPPIDAHSSPPPKRASPDSPDSANSAPTSKRRKLIRGRVESMPPTALPGDADEVIPSSETDEDDMEINPARLPPRSTLSLAAISRLSGVYLREQPLPETPTPRDGESENSQISAAETDSSEEQVSRQLEDDEDDAMDTAAADDACDDQMDDDTDEVYMATPEEDELSSESARRSIPGPSTSRSRVVVPVIKEDPPSSDTESVDSEKALERAKNARLSSLEDDDDDLLDDDLMGPAKTKRPTPELRVPRSDPKPAT
ncbi:hypothetical protein FRC00_001092 [Tulasnella sp. 408]|nr:hypothetical protein FRC00_001092 [Tulasnella sp. 408]